jgi:hypothetical protein
VSKERGKLLYQDTPYAEPENFWPAVKWWLRQDYKRGEQWEREQMIRDNQTRKILLWMTSDDYYHKSGYKPGQWKIVEDTADFIRLRFLDDRSEA